MARLILKISFLLFLLISLSTQSSISLEQNIQSSSIETQPLTNVQEVSKSLKVNPDYGNIPLYFILNEGQVHEKALFYARTSRYTLWITKEGLVFDSTKRMEKNGNSEPYNSYCKDRHKPEDLDYERDVSRLIFLNANKNPEVVPVDMTEHRVNYFRGNDPSKWRRNIETSKVVLYREIYKNIDLKIYGVEKQIEYDWVVKPGGNPEEIRFEYKNVRSTRIDKDGNLVIKTEFGEIKHKMPVSYQVIEGTEVGVEAEFRKIMENIYGFKVSEYNSDYELIIDPLVLIYSSYIGGGSDDYSYSIAVDSSGSAYVAGWTKSSDFPISSGYDTSHNGDWDVFVSKFSSDGTNLFYSSYLGGGERDGGHSIAVDSSGSAYITGSTESSDFPTPLGYDTSHNGESDVFVSKLSSDGTNLIYSSYLGGGSDEYGFSIAIDSFGSAYITGSTKSSDFPTSSGYDTSHNGYDDVFIAKLSSTGTNIIYSTFLGGKILDFGYDIAVDSFRNVYVTGMTASSNFPIPSGFDTSPNGGGDAFVSKLSSDGTNLIYSSYLGGGFGDYGYSIAVDGSGNAYVTGYTYSSDFPTSTTSYDTGYNGEGDVFVSKFSSDGTNLIYSSYLGGGGFDGGYSIAVDSSGNAYVTGYTYSSDFPTLLGYDTSHNGESDVFVSKLSSDGTNLIYSSYLGGGFSDYGYSIAVDGSGNAYVTGDTESSDFPTPSGYDTSHNGESDVFVSKISYDSDQNPTISSISPNSGSIGTLVTISGTNFGTSQGTVTFNGIKAAITSWADTQIVTTVPSGATTGPVIVHTLDGKDSNGKTFTTIISNSAQFAKTYGGDEDDEAKCVLPTNDGGYIVAGYSYSFPYGTGQSWIFKLTSDGTIEWTRIIGGKWAEYANSIQQTEDGGYIVAGFTASTADEDTDFWILKLASNGDIEWQRAYGDGGSREERASSIEKTDDGGYIVAGTTAIFGSGKSSIWILKLNSNGDIEWQRTYGGSKSNSARVIKKTDDGGYIVAGGSNSFGAIEYDIWILKLNSKGDIIWQYIYRERDWNRLYSIQQTNDGGYIIAGYTSDQLPDIWILKLNSDGWVEWQHTYDGGLTEVACSILQTNDGGYIVAGYGPSPLYYNSYDSLVLKLTSNGDIEWLRTYGSNSWEFANCIKQTDDGGYIIAGYRRHWQYAVWIRDVLVLKISSKGEIDPSCGDFIGSLDVTSSDTYIVPQETNVSPNNTSIISRDTNFTNYTWGFLKEVICKAIVTKSIEVTSPNGGESWKRGTKKDITWTSTSLTGEVTIELYKGGIKALDIGTAPVSSDGVTIASSGSYTWDIPDDESIEVGDDYKVRIYQGSVEDYSDGYFSIIEPNSITITSPNGGESWQRGTTKDITWTQTGLSGDVTIELYKGGTKVLDLGTASASSGTYSWDIPSDLVIGDDYKVKVYQGSVDDDSDDYFSITGSSYNPNDWPMFGHDTQGTSSSPSSVPNSVAEKWTPYKSGIGGRNLADISAPTVWNGKAYFNNAMDGKIYCISVSTGSLLWSKSINQGVSYPPYLSQPAVENGVVVVGSASDREALVALDANTGSDIWSYSLNLGDLTNEPVRTSPKIHNDVVYLQHCGYLYGFDLSSNGDGTTNLVLGPIDCYFGDRLAATNYSTSNLVLSSNKIFVVTGAIGVNNLTWTDTTAINKSDGSIAWHYPAGSLNYSPAILNNTLIVNNEGDLFSFDLETGSKQNILSSAIGDPCIGGGKIFIRKSTNLGFDVDLVCLDSNGNELWSYDRSWYEVRTDPVYADGKVIFGTSDSKIVCLNANGSGEKSDVLWEYSVSYSSKASISYNEIYMLSGFPESLTTASEKLYVLSAGTGPTVPNISLSASLLNFGAMIGGEKTPPQKVLITNSGSGTLNWSISSDASWLSCIPLWGTGNGKITVSADLWGVSSGTYSGTITVSDPNASNSPQAINVTLNVYAEGTSSDPFGVFSTPVDGSTVSSSIPVTGWALDDIGVESVNIYREEGGLLIYIGDAVFVEGARPDVEQAYPDYPNSYRAGWGYMLLTSFLPNGGNGTFPLQAWATDKEGNSVHLGTKTITCDNTNAIKPFGAIDTPTQGGTASGSSFLNWGWVLTPQPNSIPTDGSTINVYVDSVNIGHPTYNNYREDIANNFPGYANSDGAVGYFYLDTTAYTNGVHTIFWTATDSAGNSDGIGSRYFSISNTGSSVNTQMQGGIQRKALDIPLSFESVLNLPISYEPVKYKRGFKTDVEPEIAITDNYGLSIIEIKEVELVEVDLGEGRGYKGYMVIVDQLRPLPIGSTLDTENGIFYWQPGPGFIGEYDFIFIIENIYGEQKKAIVRIKIVPKFSQSEFVLNEYLSEILSVITYNF